MDYAPNKLTAEFHPAHLSLQLNEDAGCSASLISAHYSQNIDLFPKGQQNINGDGPKMAVFRIQTFTHCIK